MTDALHDQPAAGRFVDGEHRFPLRVYFEDTDLTGAVYHANYLRDFERARSDMLAMAGVDQRAACESGEGADAIHRAVGRYSCRWLPQVVAGWRSPRVSLRSAGSGLATMDLRSGYGRAPTGE